MLGHYDGGIADDELATSVPSLLSDSSFSVPTPSDSVELRAAFAWACLPVDLVTDN